MNRISVRPGRSRPRRALAWALSVLTLAAVGALLYEYGFAPPGGWPPQSLTVEYLHLMEFSALAMFAITRLADLVPLRQAGRRLRRSWVDYTLIVLALSAAIAGASMPGRPLLKAGTLYVITLQAVLLLRLLGGFYRVQLEFAERRTHPARLLVLSFVVVIVIGAGLLALPRCTRPAVQGQTRHQYTQHLINCLFTATSAVCVTGLVVYDTGADFTFAGQIVLLLLIQVGGLGIMILTTTIGLLLRRSLSLREADLVGNLTGQGMLGQIGRMIRFIVIVTLAIEATGAAILYPMWDASVDPAFAASGRRWFFSIFHAVSAFCNAGFALPRDNLVAYRDHWGVYTAIMPLIVLGGLGFPVLAELMQRMRWTLGPRNPRRDRRPTLLHSAHPTRASLHTQLALASTGVFILGGALLLFVTETPTRWQQRLVRDDTPGTIEINRHADDPLTNQVRAKADQERMRTVSAWSRLQAAMFQSITARTAGFNTVRTDEASLSPASHFALCILMFIGGSPGSTAGGIKTVTVAILLFAVWSTLRQRETVEVFHRSISLVIVRRAAAIVIMMLSLVTVVTLGLCYTETGSLRELLFEAVSACGTVGLSTGVTPTLTTPGKCLIMSAMLAGRVGPLTLIVAVAGRQRRERYEYPEEHPIVG